MVLRSDTLLLIEAVMSADDLVRESGLAGPRAANIEAIILNSESHHTEADGDLDKRSGIHSVNIEAVAQLARFYAAGAPRDEELRSIKERIKAGDNELADKHKGVRVTSEGSGTAREIRSRRVTYDLRAADDSFDQTATIREESEYFPWARTSSICGAPRQSGLTDRFVSARALTRERISHVACFFFER
jgi:hypothetical protein